MKTYKRKCIEDYSVTDGEKTFNISKGKEYLTSALCESGNVVVLSHLWIPVPATIFEGEIPAYGHNTEKLKNYTLLPGKCVDYYKKGFLDGIKCFAHWKDGEEFVGTTGTRLKNAEQKVTTLWNYDHPQEIPQDKSNSQDRRDNNGLLTVDKNPNKT